MIAVAKGLLSGLDTAVASTTKKDGNTPPFADTFQQVSANQTDQATRRVTQRAVRPDRASSNGKKTSEPSSFSDSVEETANVNSGGLAAGVKAGGKALAPAVARVIEGETESASDETSTAVDRKASDKADALISVPMKKGDVSQFVAKPSGDSMTGSIEDVDPQKVDVLATTAAKTAATVPESISLGSDATSTSLPVLQQVNEKDLDATGNILQSKEIPGKQTVSNREQNTGSVIPAGIASSPPKAVPSAITFPEPADSSLVAEQTLTPVLLAVATTKGFAGGAAISEQTKTTGTLSSDALVSVNEKLPAKSESERPLAVAGNIPLHRGSGPTRTLAPGQIAKPVAGSTSTKAIDHDSEEEASGQALIAGEPILKGIPSAPVLAAGSAGIDVPAQPVLQVAPKLETSETAGVAAYGQTKADGASSSVAFATGASVEIVAQGTEIAATTQMPKTTVTATSRHADSTQGKVPSAAASEPVTTFNVAAATDGIASPLATTSMVSDPTPASSALQVGISSAAGLSPMASKATSVDNAVGPVTSGGATNSPALKGAKAGGGQSGVVASDEPTQGAALEAATVVPFALSNPSGLTTDVGPIRNEAAVAASSVVKSAQQRGIVSGNTSAGKERKATVAESKSSTAAASSTSVEARPNASVTGLPIAPSASMKSSSGEHQAVTAGVGSSSAGPVGNADSLIQVAPSQVAAIAGPIVPAAQNASGSISASGSIYGTNGTDTASSAGLHGADQALSPLAHTTLSATPTVLEVGVPGGTQGWLKIRAEIGEGGVVQASMSASTHAGQDALRRDLPAMTAFLESEHVPVNLQVTHGASAGSLTDGNGLLKDSGFNPGSSLGQSLNQNANSSAGSGQSETTSGTPAGGDSSRQNGGQPRDTTGLVSDSVLGAASTGAAAGVADSDWSAVGYGSGSTANGGSWLNVIA